MPIQKSSAHAHPKTLQHVTTQNPRFFQFTLQPALAYRSCHLAALTSWTHYLTAVGVEFLSCHAITTNICFILESLQTVSICVHPLDTHTALISSCCR